MNITELESQLRELVERPYDASSFAIDFLSVFDNIPKSTLTKLRQGTSNQSSRAGDLLWKGKLFFRPTTPGNAAWTVDQMLADPLTKRHAPQFVMSTDGVEFYCKNTKSDLSIDLPLSKLNDAFDFFLPLAGFERYEGFAENQADIKATGKLAKLYDAILEANADWIGHDHTHELNLFMARLLFCLFAEDTGIFEKKLFTHTAMNFTNDDGSGVAPLLSHVFEMLDTPQDARGGKPDYLTRFPYVNGGLFREHTPVPKFGRRARRLLKECGELAWQEINPDIFGSMIQAVVEPGMRGDMGMHYTSVPNIMKVLHPLFLLSLEEDFDEAKDSEAKLNKLLQRIYNIRVFDPACGSGNFLIIAYRELRKLENRIFQRLREIARQWALPMTGVKLNHFYGIELADFACETAKLSMWIAEYQMNEQFKAMFGSAPPALPLRDSGNIVHDNSTLIDWSSVCPNQPGTEIYIVGNPPYVGARYQTADQKSDMARVFRDDEVYKDCDYVGCWLLKASEYAHGTNTTFAFVTTNSITQGEQVANLWPKILSDYELFFAYQAFKWINNAADKAGVTCVIVGIRSRSTSKGQARYLYYGETRQLVDGITPYLTAGPLIYVRKAKSALNGLPRMLSGNMARDGGQLFLTPAERDQLVAAHPESAPLVRRALGSDELIKGRDRYCVSGTFPPH